MTLPFRHITTSRTFDQFMQHCQQYATSTTNIIVPLNDETTDILKKLLNIYGFNLLFAKDILEPQVTPKLKPNITFQKQIIIHVIHMGPSFCKQLSIKHPELTTKIRQFQDAQHMKIKGTDPKQILSEGFKMYQGIENIHIYAANMLQPGYEKQEKSQRIPTIQQEFVPLIKLLYLLDMQTYQVQVLQYDYDDRLIGDWCEYLY